MRAESFAGKIAVCNRYCSRLHAGGWVQAIQQQLASEGVPTTVVDLTDSSRPTITSSFLSGTLANGTPVGYFQGVVLPSDAPSQLSAAELNALASYETAFSVRQVDAYLYPTGNVGMNAPAYGGPLDGTQVTVTAAAQADNFGYLKGTFDFEGTAGGTTSYGYLGSDYTTLGSGPLTLVLETTPYPSGSAAAAPTATKSPKTRSTNAINDVVNPLAVPKGRLGKAILKATEGS